MDTGTVFESWKQIASYLHRNIRTCQTWEREMGLPVHRLDGSPKARVFAYQSELDAWIAEKTRQHEDEKEAAKASPRRRRLALLAGAVAAFVLLGGAAWLGYRGLKQPPVVFPTTGMPGVTFFPFENVTRDPALESWRTALPRLFALEMVPSRLVSVQFDAGPYIMLKRLGLLDAPKLTGEDMKKLAAAYRGGYLITGDLIRSDRDIIVNLRIHEGKTGEVFATLRAFSRGEKGLFAAVDELSRKIKLALNLPRRLVDRDIDDEIAKTVTDSPGALMAYCQGIQLDYEGRTPEATACYEKAVQIDPGFAEAYYWLFYDNFYPALQGTRDRNEVDRYAQKAFEHRDRLNFWARGVLADLYYVRFRPDLDRAISEFRRMLATAQGDPILKLQLALIYARREEHQQVIDLLDDDPKEDERIVALLADACLRAGDADRADRLLEAYQAGHRDQAPGSRVVLRARQLCALAMGREDEALAFNERLQASASRPVNSVAYGKAGLLITLDNLGGAERELVRITREGRPTEKIEARLSLAGLCLTQGRLGAARGEAEAAVGEAEAASGWALRKRAHALKAAVLDAAGEREAALIEAETAATCDAADDFYVDPRQNAKTTYEHDDVSCLPYFYLRALITLKLGRIDEFDKRLAEVKELVGRSQYPRLARVYHHLLGLRELETGDPAKAIGHFYRAIQRLPSSYGHEADIDAGRYYFALGEAYERAGRTQSALDSYGKVSPFWEQRVLSGDLYARTYFRLARLYDRRSGTAGQRRGGDRLRAVENYRKFLKLREEADPPFAAEVREARERLAVLAPE